MGLNKTIHILPLPRFLNRLLHVYSAGFSFIKVNKKKVQGTRDTGSLLIACITYHWSSAKAVSTPDAAIPSGHEIKLAELLEANHPLNTVYVMKTTLKEMWYAPDKARAQARWNKWYKQCNESGIRVLQQFAYKLKKYLRGIIASATHRLNTSILEGMNIKIKVLKRMAYGYRDNDYFFLKIKAAFPSKVR